MRPDYLQFRFSKLNTPEFEHIKLLLYWLIFGAIFWSMEIFLPMHFHNVYCSLDDKIPFCEYFVVPYYFWFVYLIGMMVYGFFFDVPAFKNYMYFTILTYTATLVIYAIYPTEQNLRPDALPRDNVFTNVVKFLYGFDTNTNVCPSIHVLGSMAVYFAARKSKAFGALWCRIVFLIATIIISVSTVFLKQHSVIDIAVAVIIGLIAYPFVYKKDSSVETIKETEAVSK